MKFLYKYPQKAFPYQQLVDENAKRGKTDKEYQLLDTGIFEEDRYWDIVIETAKDDEDPDEILFRVTAWNRGPEPAPLHIIPHVWFRNTWAWGREAPDKKPSIAIHGENMAKSKHPKLGEHYVLLSPSPGVGPSGEDVMPELLFTDNDTNTKVLYEQENKVPYVKDAMHRYIVNGEKAAVNPAQTGTKMGAWFQFNESGGVAPGECAGQSPDRLRPPYPRADSSSQSSDSVSPRRARPTSTRRISITPSRSARTKPTISTTDSAPYPCRMTCAISSARPSRA